MVVQSRCFRSKSAKPSPAFPCGGYQARFAPNALLQRRSSIQQMGKTVCSLVRYRRRARSRNSVNYTSQFVGGWPKKLFGVSTRIDIIFACLYWLNGKLFHPNLAGLLTQLLNKRTVLELDRHNLLFGCVLLILSVSLIAIPAISQEKRYRHLIVRSESVQRFISLAIVFHHRV